MKYSGLAAMALLLLSGCGFHSVYGAHGKDGSPVAQELSLISITNIPDRPGQMLKNDLIDRFYGKNGRPAQPKYKLEVKLRTTEEDLGLLADATTSRAVINSYGDYTLTDISGKEKLASGTAHSVTSFNTLNQQYSTQVARDSATQRTIDEVSEQIANAVSLYFADRDEKKDGQ